VNSTLLAVFIACAAAAILLQAVVLFAFYKAATESSRRMQETLGRMERKTDPILTAAQAILEDAQPKISEITANLAETSAMIRANVSQMADATGEIVDRARMQAARLDDLINATLAKVEQTTDFLQHTVVTPVRRIHAVIQAVNAGLSFFKRGRSGKRHADAEAGEDEEMFI
jgi:hypothetical protein